jgi:hypothetical protein
MSPMSPAGRPVWLCCMQLPTRPQYTSDRSRNICRNQTVIKEEGEPSKKKLALLIRDDDE